jgi:hypothetical protein
LIIYRNVETGYNILKNGAPMPIKDEIHDIVKAALIKDGWTITHDPFALCVVDLEKQEVTQWIN